MDLVDYQNAIIKAFTGLDKDVMIKLNYTKDPDSSDCANSTFNSCQTYKITNTTSNPNISVYALFDTYSVKNNAKVYLDILRPMIINSLSKEVELTLQYSQRLVDEDFYVSTYDKQNLIEHLTLLQKNMLKDIKINKNKMTANINSSKDGILFLTVPYDKRFEIYVDGKKVKHYPLLDNSFVGFDIKSGEHKITVEYHDHKAILYIIASVGSLLITIVLGIFINKKITKRQKEEQAKKQEELQKNAERKAKREEKNKKSKEKSKKNKKRR